MMPAGSKYAHSNEELLEGAFLCGPCSSYIRWNNGARNAIVKQKYMVMDPEGPVMKNDCAGKAQQRFT
jgi:hypothetical protein